MCRALDLGPYLEHLSPVIEGYNKVLAQAAKEVLVSNPQLEADEIEAAWQAAPDPTQHV
jgi:hypothetical protein